MTTMTSMSNSSSTNSQQSSSENNILGWEGFTLTLPPYWSLASFAGDRAKGNFRITDEDGTRVEVVWETPKGTPNLERSIENLSKSWEKEAKKKKQNFSLANNPPIVLKTRQKKEQLINFGWKGDSKDPMAAHGWGVGWHCAECGRVVVAHMIGRGRETSGTAQRLASEIFSSMECHNHGGWDTWNVFGFQVDIPENFALKLGKLQTGKIEMEWENPRPADWWMTPKWWGRRPERIGVQRLSAANLVLIDQDMETWAKRMVPRCNKKYLFTFDEDNSTDEQIWFTGKTWNLRQRLSETVWQILLRRPRQEIRATVWRDENDNKLLFAFFDLTSQNAHVQDDVLDSIATHTLN